jgi:hypothetical protein
MWWLISVSLVVTSFFWRLLRLGRTEEVRVNDRR